MPYYLDRYTLKMQIKTRYGTGGYGNNGSIDSELFSNKQLDALVEIIADILVNVHPMPLSPPVTAEQVLELFMKRLVEHDYTGGTETG